MLRLDQVCAVKNSPLALQARRQPLRLMVHAYLCLERADLQPVSIAADCHDFEFDVLHALLGVEHFREHAGSRVLTMEIMSSGELQWKGLYLALLEQRLRYPKALEYVGLALVQTVASAR